MGKPINSCKISYKRVRNFCKQVNILIPQRQHSVAKTTKVAMARGAAWNFSVLVVPAEIFLFIHLSKAFSEDTPGDTQMSHSIISVRCTKKQSQGNESLHTQPPPP
jgi:hypothetical protein